MKKVDNYSMRLYTVTSTYLLDSNQIEKKEYNQATIDQEEKAKYDPLVEN